MAADRRPQERLTPKERQVARWLAQAAAALAIARYAPTELTDLD